MSADKKREMKLKPCLQKTHAVEENSRQKPHRQDLAEEERVDWVHPSIHSCSKTSKEHVGPFRSVIFQNTSHWSWFHHL